ncbi:MAG TPA: alpha/beta hydrolase, partial [Burkholderiales bacterium]|nr:alpha/beta hydrolase [Burkholderiales bacterium]
MPTFKHGDATLYYEEHGKGFPILTFSPAGLRSDIAAWDGAPMHPVKEWSGSYRVIVMDQRNTGRSRAPITAKDGWHTYASDHAAVLDHA